MPVEAVELIVAHHVKHAFHLVGSEEMTAHVEHESAVAEPRLVGYLHHGKRIFGHRRVFHSGHHIGGKHLLHTLKRIIEPYGSGRSHRHAVSCDRERIALFRQRLVDTHSECRRSGSHGCGIESCGPVQIRHKAADLLCHVVRQPGRGDLQIGGYHIRSHSHSHGLWFWSEIDKRRRLLGTEHSARCQHH